MMSLWSWNKDSCNFDRNQQAIIKLFCSVLILYQYSYVGYIPGCLQQTKILLTALTKQKQSHYCGLCIFSKSTEVHFLILNTIVILGVILMLNKKMIGYESQATKPGSCFCTVVFSYKQH